MIMSMKEKKVSDEDFKSKPVLFFYMECNTSFWNCKNIVVCMGKGDKCKAQKMWDFLDGPVVENLPSK